VEALFYSSPFMGYYAVRRNVRIPVYATIDEKVHQRTQYNARDALYTLSMETCSDKNCSFTNKTAFQSKRPPANKILRFPHTKI